MFAEVCLAWCRQELSAVDCIRELVIQYQPHSHGPKTGHESVNFSHKHMCANQILRWASQIEKNSLLVDSIDLSWYSGTIVVKQRISFFELRFASHNVFPTLELINTTRRLFFELSLFTNGQLPKPQYHQSLRKLLMWRFKYASHQWEWTMLQCAALTLYNATYLDGSPVIFCN